MSTEPISSDLKIGQCLFGSSAYSIQEFIGEGAFGKVAKCKDLLSKETLAVKILKQNSSFDVENETYILEQLSVFDPDRINVVKFIEQFETMDQACFVFEMLQKNLFDLILEQNCEPLFMLDIRPIANQLLVALDALKGLRILHADLKADNVMLVHQQNQPYRVKLIDFGMAMMSSEVEPGMQVQAIGYRAPEVAFGLLFNEAIDMWGLGCTLAFLYLAEHPFPVHCQYQTIRGIVKLLGQPNDHMLQAGLYSKCFFCKVEGSWRLLTPEEYAGVNKLKPKKRRRSSYQLSCLDDLVDIYPVKEAAEYEDRRAFVDFLKGLLHLEGDKRIAPQEALQHPFITLSHLVENPDSRAYLTAAQTVKKFLGASADRAELAVVLNRRLTSEDDSAEEPLEEDCLVDGADLSEKGQGFESNDEDSGSWSSEEFTSYVNEQDLVLMSYHSDLSSRNSEEDLLSSLKNPETDSVRSIHVVPSSSDNEDSVSSSSSSSSFSSSSSSSSSDGEASIYSTPAAPASSGRKRKILRRISKFFRNIAKAFCCCCDVED